MPPGSGAVTVWFETLNPASAAIDEYINRIGDHGVKQGDCARQPKAWQEWQVPAIFTGHLVCYGEPGASWVVWTYEAEGVFARATRPDTNAASLFTWWKATAPFLRD